MADRTLSRRNFLVGASAVVGLAVAPSLLGKPSAAQASASKDFPWTYIALDADKVARRAYETYYSSGCMEATWWPIVEALTASSIPDAATTWGTITKDMMKYGGGGVGGWGTICGTLNGSCAAMGAIGVPSKMIDEHMQYYAITPIPSSGVENAVAAGWVPAGTNVPAAPLANVVTSTANSQLCHASLSQWTTKSGVADGTIQQKDRCAKACYDMVFEAVTMMNAWKANGTIPVGAVDHTVAECGACHTAPIAKGKMACDTCHTDRVGHHGWGL